MEIMNRKQYQKEYRKRNKEKNEAYQKEYRKKNRERLLQHMSEYGKKWYQENKEKKDAQNKEWAQNNPQKCVKNVQRYVVKNKEKVSAYNKEFDQRYEGKYRLIKHRHFQRWNTEIFSLDEFIVITKNSCTYCGNLNTNKGIDRIDNKYGYTKENSASCCKLCNFMKNKYSKSDFLSHIRKIYEHNH